MSLTSASSSTSTACDAVQLNSLASTHSGWLYRYSHNSFIKSWKRRYFVLTDERLYMFKENYPTCKHHDVLDLTTFRSVQQISNPRKTRFGFLLRSQRRPSVFDDPNESKPAGLFELELYADTEAIMSQWISEISKVFVAMDMRTFKSPLTSFDKVVQRAGQQSGSGSSILSRLEKQRKLAGNGNATSTATGTSGLSHNPSASTLITTTSSSPPTTGDQLTLTPLG